MSFDSETIPGVTDDPVLRLILVGRASTLHDAEGWHLDGALDDISRLIASPLDDDASSATRSCSSSPPTAAAGGRTRSCDPRPEARAGRHGP